MRTIFLLVFAAVFAAVVEGCANIQLPLKAVVDPKATVSREATFAFYPESDIRLEKRLFYERAAPILARAGFRIVQPDKADFLVRLVITAQQVTSVDIDLPSGAWWRTGGYSGVQGSPPVRTQLKEGDSAFRFVVYPGAAVKQTGMASVWEATVVATQRDFRAHEQEVLERVFARLGASYDGYIVFPKTANNFPQPAPVDGRG